MRVSRNKRRLEANQKPLVTVIIPAYNSQKYIRRAIESVMAQTCSDWKIIVVNEFGSDDGTAEIVKGYKNPNICLIQNRGRRLGLGESRNVGIVAAKSKYVAFLDADDECLPDRLERQVDFLENNPEFIGCGSRVVMMRGQKECGETFWHPMGEDNFKTTLLFMTACLPSTMMFRRADLVKQKLYFFAEKCLEDHDFLVKVCTRNRMVNLPQPVIRYYLSSAQMSSNPQIIEREKAVRYQIISAALQNAGCRADFDDVYNYMYGNYDKMQQKKRPDSIYKCFRFFAGLYGQLLKSGLYSKESLNHIFNHKFANNYNYFKDKDTSAKKYHLGLNFEYNLEQQKIKVYFLFHSKAFWPSWESFWEACKSDCLIEAKMIFCPVKKQGQGFSGQFDDAKQWLIDKQISFVEVDDIDFDRDKPDVLIMQTPYDEWHRYPHHHSFEFAARGIRIVYISYGLEFTESKDDIKHQFRQPVQVFSWRIYTFCKNLLADYARFCPAGSAQVRCLGHPKFDALFEARRISMPKWLKDKINGRKVICWHPHFPCDYSRKNGEKVLSTFSWAENLKILNYIKNDTKNFYIFMAHHMFFGVFENRYQVPAEEIAAFQKQLREASNSTIWEDNYPEVLGWCDAFLGERSAVTMEMITTGKPVCYLAPCSEIYNRFGQEVINAYTCARNYEQVEEFLNAFH